MTVGGSIIGGNGGAYSVTDIGAQLLGEDSFVEVYDGCTVHREKVSNEAFTVSGMSLNQLFGKDIGNAFFNSGTYLRGNGYSSESESIYTGSNYLNGISFGGSIDIGMMLRPVLEHKLVSLLEILLYQFGVGGGGLVMGRRCFYWSKYKYSSFSFLPVVL